MPGVTISWGLQRNAEKKKKVCVVGERKGRGEYFYKTDIKEETFSAY